MASKGISSTQVHWIRKAHFSLMHICGVTIIDNKIQ